MPRKRRNSGFWECMTITESGCWEWQGYREPAGYGQVRVERKLYKTHRYAFEQIHGHSPEVVLHKCDNPPCCNPEHLIGGTHADNVADRVSKGRTRTGQIHGEANNFAKLTADQVLAIRAAYAAGGITQTDLARQYNVTQSAIYLIVNRKKWSHL